jgi:hypothetical protein
MNLIGGSGEGAEPHWRCVSKVLELVVAQQRDWNWDGAIDIEDDDKFMSQDAITVVSYEQDDAGCKTCRPSHRSVEARVLLLKSYDHHQWLATREMAWMSKFHLC